MGPKKRSILNSSLHRTMNYSQRRPLYLLQTPLSDINPRKLPTNGTVLRYYQYTISDRCSRFSSTHTNFSCPRATNSSDLICKSYTGRHCDEKTGVDCVLRKVVNIWVACGFGNYLITERSIIVKFEKLHKQWKYLCRKETTFKKTSLNKSQTVQKSEVQQVQEQQFRDLMNGLFDIAADNFEKLMRSDTFMPRSKESVIEDLEFLEDQRSARKMEISHQYDLELEETVRRRTERYRRHENYRKKIAEQGLCEPLPEEENTAPDIEGAQRSPFDDDSDDYDVDDNDVDDNETYQTVSEDNTRGKSNLSTSGKKKYKVIKNYLNFTLIHKFRFLFNIFKEFI